MGFGKDILIGILSALYQHRHYIPKHFWMFDWVYLLITENLYHQKKIVHAVLGLPLLKHEILQRIHRLVVFKWYTGGPQLTIIHSMTVQNLQQCWKNGLTAHVWNYGHWSPLWLCDQNSSALVVHSRLQPEGDCNLFTFTTTGTLQPHHLSPPSMPFWPPFCGNKLQQATVFICTPAFIHSLQAPAFVHTPHLLRLAVP